MARKGLCEPRTDAVTASDLDLRIGRSIQIRRMGLGWSRRQLARDLQIPAADLVRYEKGAVRVPPALLAEIAARFLVDLPLFFASLGDADPVGIKRRRDSD